MKEWLRKYKKKSDIEDEDTVTYVDTLLDTSSMLFKSIMGYDLDDDEDLKRTVSMSNLPIKYWNWQTVVHWIEKLDEFKSFSSVFCEWKINGNELLQMNAQQIDFLTRCCYRPEKAPKDTIKDLMIATKKQMISTCITYEFGLYYQQLYKEKENDICQFLDYLRPQKDQGPKALWKLDAFYFSKINNMLAILLAPKGCRELFREWFPTFIFDDGRTHENVIKKQRTASMSMTNTDNKLAFSVPNKQISSSVTEALTPLTPALSEDVEYDSKTDLMEGGTGTERTETLKDESQQQREKEEKEAAAGNNSPPTVARYVDPIDTFSNVKYWKDTKCATFIRNFDRAYLKVIFIILAILSIGCLIIWTWMSRRSREEVEEAINWTAESIADRAIQYMEHQFFIPQMVLNIAIGGLFSADISINSDDYLQNAQFDSFFVQYEQYKISESSIYALCMYESVNNTMICSEGETTEIFVFNGTCGRSYEYDENTKERDVSKQTYFDCTYDPKSRPWYQKALALDVDDIGWTDPYIFAGSTDAEVNTVIGISLVRRVIYNGVEVIFFTEFTTEELNMIFDNDIGSLLDGGVSFLAMNGDVIASSNGEIDIIDGTASDGTITNDELLKNTAALLRENMNAGNGTVLEKNEYKVMVNSVKTTYLIGDNIEYATIAVAYDDSYLSKIREAEALAMALYIVAILSALIFLCGMASYLQFLQSQIKETVDPYGAHILRAQKSVDLEVVRERMSSKISKRDTLPEAIKDEAREKDKAYISSKYDSYLIESDLVCDHRSITLCSFWYMVIIFVLTFFIWRNNVDSILDDTTDQFFTEEYMVVQDKISEIVIIAESMADIVQDRFVRDDMSVDGSENINVEMDVFFANIMNSFKRSDDNFLAEMVYMGLPDGRFVGAQRESNEANIEKYGHTLRIAVRDNSTNWDYLKYASNDDDSGKRMNVSDPVSQTKEYDPRCRSWFKAALSYMVSTDIWDAFGGTNNFLNFVDENVYEGCNEYIAYYQSIWNVTSDEMNENFDNLTMSEYESLSLEQNTVYKELSVSFDFVWSQYLFASGDLGITGSKPIFDANGQVLAVLAIDFTLEGLSNYLNSTNNDNANWYTWIFRGDEYGEYKMIASSDDNITEPLQQVEGCIQANVAANRVVQYDALSHPNTLISIMTQEVNKFYMNTSMDIDGMWNHSLPINKSGIPIQIDLPIDLPDTLAGRFLTFPSAQSSDSETSDVWLDWIVVKSINIDTFKEKKEDDIKTIGFLIFTLLFLAYMIFGNLSLSTVKEEEQGSVQMNEEEEIISNADASSANLSKMNSKDTKQQIQKAQEKYSELMEEMLTIVESSSAEIWDLFLRSFKGQIGNYPISTEIVRDFMATESNKHIETDKKGDLTLTLCALQIDNRWIAFKVLKFIKSYAWNVIMNIVIALHMIASVQLPETPTKLKQDGFSDATAALAISFISVAIIIEIIDVVLQGIARFILFGVVKEKYLSSLVKLRYGFKHKFNDQIEEKSPLWLTFFGLSNWRLFQIHIFLVFVIVFNTLLMVSPLRIAPFEYYLPAVPLLLAVRSEDIRLFSNQFFYAVYLAKDVLFSYSVLILIVAILGLSVFGDILNPNESTDTFRSSMRALITSFVYISTGENYNEVVYNAIVEDNIFYGILDNTYSMLNLAFFVVMSFIGLYFFTPIMIHKFEVAFNHSQSRLADKTLKTRRNSIIAAFIMLDMNDDGEISVDEFQHLVHSSIISRDVLFDTFANASGDEDNQISLYEFTSTLTNRAAFSVAINGIKCETSRFQAFLECNWYRRRKNRYYLLIFFVVPSVCIALLRGLSGIDPWWLDTMVHVFFVLHFLDINLRIYAFGRKRYFSLIKFENPSFIQQSIHNWRIDRGIIIENGDDDGDFSKAAIRLSYSSKKWCNRYLRAIKPLSNWDKMTLSTIHTFEFYLIYFGLIGIFLTFIFKDVLKGYYYLFIQMYLFRLFTLIEANQRLIVLIFTIIPHFLNLLSFLGIFIFIWARIGCTIFANKTDIVLDEIYSTSAEANFNTLGSSFLALIQLMVGEGWHEIMYLNIIATRIEYCLYFIAYIVIVTLIISNIFVGLFLSEIEGLDNKQAESKLMHSWMESHYNFTEIAQKRKTDLEKKYKEIQVISTDLAKQLAKINKLLKKKAKKKKSKWNLLNKVEDDMRSDDEDEKENEQIIQMATSE